MTALTLTRRALSVFVLTVLLCSTLVAQQQRPDRNRRWDPEQFRQRMMERMKEQLGVGDTEWKVLSPRIEKVMTLSRETSVRSGSRRRRRDDDRPQEEPTTAVGKAAAKLRTLLEAEKADPEAIKTALNELRSARLKAMQELDKARAQLKELITVKQEAQLVMMGILE